MRLISTVALFVNLSMTWTVACSCFYKELSEGVSAEYYKGSDRRRENDTMA